MPLSSRAPGACRPSAVSWTSKSTGPPCAAATPCTGKATSCRSMATPVRSMRARLPRASLLIPISSRCANGPCRSRIVRTRETCIWKFVRLRVKRSAFGRKSMSIVTKMAGIVGLALCVGSAPTAASAKDVLKSRKIGVIVINTGSESLARWANNVQAAAAKLHWDVIIKNGESNPAVVATLLPELLTQGVDAVITMAVDAPLMAQGLTEAKAKNVPVIATVVGVNPAGRDNFTAVYAINDYELGIALANYLVDKNAKAVALGQTA